MREIKFRGKSAIDDEWVYGYFVKSKYYRNQPILYSYIHTPHQKEYSKPSTIMMIETGTQGQFTGLQDKNGVDAYYGDIIEIDTYLIEGDYHTKKHIAVLTDNDFEFGAVNLPSEPFNWTSLIHLNQVTFEIIGNVHDKKLLK